MSLIRTPTLVVLNILVSLKLRIQPFDVIFKKKYEIGTGVSTSVGVELLFSSKQIITIFEEKCQCSETFKLRI